MMVGKEQDRDTGVGDEGQSKNAKVHEERRKKLGQRLAFHRRAKGLSQREVAEAVGQLYYTFVSHVENGRTRIPPTDLEIWAEVLGVDLHALAKECIRAYEPPELFNAIYPRGERQSDL